MTQGRFREIRSEKQLTENEKLYQASNEIFQWFANSPYRRMIIISLLSGEKDIHEIKDDIRRMLGCELKFSNKAFDFLLYCGFIERVSGKFKLTEKGKNIGEIFRISLKIFEEGEGTA